MISSEHSKIRIAGPCASSLLLGVAILVPVSFASGLAAQSLGLNPPQASGPTASSYQGSVPTGEATAQPIGLSLDDAIQRGLTSQSRHHSERHANRFGARPAAEPIAVAAALGGLQRARKPITQVDLPAEGLRIPDFPNIIGPFGYTDVRASLSWSLVDLHSLRNYLAARHNFAAAQLSAEDARDMVVLTVGNAYLLVLADRTAGGKRGSPGPAHPRSRSTRRSPTTTPEPRRMLDELSARVDYQSQQQQLIAARNALEKDKLALARTIGLPLAQSFTLTDQAPYAVFDQFDVAALIAQAHANRKDLAALVEQAKAAEEQRKAAAAERLPTVKADADYGDIGTTLSHSHGTVDATGTLSVPVFKEFELRGEAQQAQAQPRHGAGPS